MPRNPLNPRLSNGERIREVCEITERLGKATSPMVRARMDGPQTTSNAAKYCSRAAKVRIVLKDVVRSTKVPVSSSSPMRTLKRAYGLHWPSAKRQDSDPGQGKLSMPSWPERLQVSPLPTHAGRPVLPTSGHPRRTEPWDGRGRECSASAVARPWR